MMTDPDAAADYVKQTGVDILAIAIGNCHGLYKFPPKLDVQRLIAIRKKVSIPVVLHGGSDTPVQMAKDVIANGVTKFNIGTDLKYAYARKLKETMNTEPMPYQPPAVMDRRVKRSVQWHVRRCSYLIAAVKPGCTQNSRTLPAFVYNGRFQPEAPFVFSGKIPAGRTDVGVCCN